MNRDAVRRLIMLDFDGVVYDTLDGWCSAVITGLRAHGFARFASRDWVLKLVEDNWFAGLVRVGVPQGVMDEIDEHFGDFMATHEMRPFPGMPAVVGRLARLHRVAVITSNRTDFVEELLSAAGIDGVAEVLGGDVEPSKVRKIGLALAAARDDAGLSGAPADAWFVGDTVGDIVEARRAGVRTLAVTWGWHDEAQLVAAAPDRIARRPEELLDLLE